MNEVVSGNLFGVVISLTAYYIGWKWNQKFHNPLLNPLLLAIAMVIAFLKIFHIPLEDYNAGGNIIAMFLTPATAVLAFAVYKQILLLKKYWIPIFAGCFVGAMTSMISVYWLCRFLKLDEHLVASMIPKSVTTPIAMEVSMQLGGIPAITVAAVIITGIIGAILSPVFIRLLGIQNHIAAGVAIGSSSHAVGTSKALELGEVEGAMSGISIGISGIITVILALFL